MREAGFPEHGDGVPDRDEVVADGVAVDPELFGDQRRVDDPRVVGQLDHVAADRTGDRDRSRAGPRASDRGGVGVPGKLKAAMVGRLHRDLGAERDDAAGVDLGDRETGMGSADIGGDDLH